jgi:hypothetical protein
MEGSCSKFAVEQGSTPWRRIFLDPAQGGTVRWYCHCHFWRRGLDGRTEVGDMRSGRADGGDDMGVYGGRAGCRARGERHSTPCPPRAPPSGQQRTRSSIDMDGVQPTDWSATRNRVEGLTLPPFCYSRSIGFRPMPPSCLPGGVAASAQVIAIPLVRLSSWRVYEANCVQFTRPRESTRDVGHCKICRV